MVFVEIVMAVVAYLIGSLSAAVLISKKMGLDDPRTYGSGNPGATNVLRSGNKKAAAWTLAGDALKGLVAVLLARWFASWLHLPDGAVALSAIGVVLGHLFPIFFHFKGGKGVATSFGVILGMSFWTAAWVLAFWAVVAFKFKKSSLAALVAAGCAPFLAFIIIPQHPRWGWALVLVAALVTWRHKDNVQRLREGSEPAVGETAAADAAAQQHPAQS